MSFKTNYFQIYVNETLQECESGIIIDFLIDFVTFQALRIMIQYYNFSR